MKLGELVEEYERRQAAAARHGATAPLAKVYRIVLEELRAVDGTENGGRRVTTSEAADLISVSAKTIRRWANDGRFPGARKTSKAGEWRIPVRDVYAAAGRDVEQERIPKLWRPDDE